MLGDCTRLACPFFLKLSPSRGSPTAELPCIRSHGTLGRPGWGIISWLWALLALEDGVRQSELGEFANVSQLRISQALSESATLDLVERVPAGWTVTDKAKAFTRWVNHYPGPGGLASHWYGLDPVVLAAAGLAPAVPEDATLTLVALVCLADEDQPACR